MSASQRVSLTKACSQCIMAKRKCSKVLPKCQRCAKQGLACCYKNAPLLTSRGKSPAAKIVASNQETHGSYSMNGRRSSNTDLNNPSVHGSSGSGSSDVAFANKLPSSSLTCIRLDPPDVIMTWDRPTMDYLTGHLRSFTTMFAQTGGTPFIHPKLYQSGLPPILQNVYTICCLQAHVSQDDHSIISQSIAGAAAALVNAISSAHTFSSLLELVQSLILLQIITLLQPTTSHNPCSQAASRMPLLISLTKKLFQSIPVYLPSSLGAYEAWILAESVRRTLHIAHKVRAVYSVMTSGQFVLTSFVETLPFNQNTSIWASNSLAVQEQQSVEDGTSLASLETDLISYRELVVKWDMGEVYRPGLFEEMLIVACKGATCGVQNGENQIS